MNATEAAKLLTVAAGFDRRQVTEVTATAWAEALQGHPYLLCERAIIGHFRDPATRHEYLTVGHVLDRVEAAQRANTGDVEADVRSAKARGLIAHDWPKREPLPPATAAALAQCRGADRAELRLYLELGGA